LKRAVWIDFSPPNEENTPTLEWLKEFRIFLLDANVLKAIAYRDDDRTRFVQPLARLMTERNEGLRGVCGVADFVKIECFNMERHVLGGGVKIRRFLKAVENDADGFYVEFRTPIRRVHADDRKRFLNFLPRRERRILLKKCEYLSGTDMLLLVLAVFLKVSGISVVVASFDKDVAEASEELGVTVYPGNNF